MRYTDGSASLLRENRAENTAGTFYVGRGLSSVRCRSVISIVWIGSGNNSSSNDSVTPIPKLPPTGDAINPNHEKEVFHPQFALREPTVEYRVTICSNNTLSSMAGDVFSVTVKN